MHNCMERFAVLENLGTSQWRMIPTFIGQIFTRQFRKFRNMQLRQRRSRRQHTIGRVI